MQFVGVCNIPQGYTGIAEAKKNGVMGIVEEHIGVRTQRLHPSW